MSVIDEVRERHVRARHMLKAILANARGYSFVEDRVTESLAEIDRIDAALEQYEVVEGWSIEGQDFQGGHLKPSSRDRSALLLVEKP